MKERRNLQRYPLQLPTIVGFINKSNKRETKNLLTQNISEAGAYYCTSNRLSPDTEVDLKIFLSLAKFKRVTEKLSLITVNGIVCRSESDGMAIRFYEECEIIPVRFSICSPDDAPKPNQSIKASTPPHLI
jgi:hypothetical protein